MIMWETQYEHPMQNRVWGPSAFTPFIHPFARTVQERLKEVPVSSDGWRYCSSWRERLVKVSIEQLGASERQEIGWLFPGEVSQSV